MLSSRFAERNGIPGIPMRSRPVDLAVSSARVSLTHKTRPLELKIGNTVIKKSLYLLPVPQFDAIVGMPFFRENEIDLAGLERGIIEINGSQIPMTRVGLPNSAGSSLFGLFGSASNRTKSLFESCRTEQTSVRFVFVSNRTITGPKKFCSRRTRTEQWSVRFEFVRDVRENIPNGKTQNI